MRRLTRSATVGLIALVTVCLLGIEPAVAQEDVPPTTDRAAALAEAAGQEPVRLVVDAPAGDPAALAELPGAIEVEELYGTDRVVVEVVPEEVGPALDAIEAAGGAFVEVDHLVQTALTPNDPLWNSGAHRGFRSMGFTRAWDFSTGRSSVIIAVLDTGVNPVSELSGRVISSGRDFVSLGCTGGCPSSATDSNGHGTMAATVAAGRGNNNAGYAGACWGCRVMPVRVLDSTGSGPQSAVASGIRWAADNGAKVISMSLAGQPTTANSPQTLVDAVAYARSRGAVVVSAAGNDGQSLRTYPAATPGVIGVGGFTFSGERRVRHPSSNHGSWVDVAGPFTNGAQNRNGTYGSFHGTSSATPVVAGAAALAWSARPGLTRAQVEQAILSSAASMAGTKHGVVRAPRVIDFNAPTVTVSAGPQSLFGTVSIVVRASDDFAGIAGRPSLQVGSTSIPLTSSGSGRWVGRWDTRSIAYGRRTLTATASDRAGNTGTRTVSVRVLNTPPQSGFFDVPRGAFFARPVDWLAYTGVTTGVDPNRYDPQGIVTRGQMAVFLWRLAGRPAAGGANFVDVPGSAYYAEATRWLRQARITTGIGGSNRFDPHGPVTREQMVTFLHRFAGLPRADRRHSFVDVHPSSFADSAVSWAAHHGITTGVGGSNRFDPRGWVTRGQMAAFVHRFAHTRAARPSGAVPIRV